MNWLCKSLLFAVFVAGGFASGIPAARRLESMPSGWNGHSISAIVAAARSRDMIWHPATLSPRRPLLALGIIVVVIFENKCFEFFQMRGCQNRVEQFVVARIQLEF